MRHPQNPSGQSFDVCIAGAGIIGLSLAIELSRRGLSVAVFDRTGPLSEASTAAAGMLAAHDPENPAELQSISNLSLALYPAFLAHIANLSGIAVPFQTRFTLQGLPPHASSTGSLTREALGALLPQLHPSGRQFILLDEHSIDPRQLAAALLAAVSTTAIRLSIQTPVLAVHSYPTAVNVETPSQTFSASKFIDCSGAWATAASPLPHLTIRPIKGQMLRLALPTSLPLQIAVRTPEIYIVPRTRGPHAGHAIVGATSEDIGFDKTVNAPDIAALKAAATALLPQLGTAAIVESWAGLRPSTNDALPILGQHPEHPRVLFATGHFRNGILLAPATANLLAQLICDEAPSIDLTRFSPARTPPSHS